MPITPTCADSFTWNRPSTWRRSIDWRSRCSSVRFRLIPALPSRMHSFLSLIQPCIIMGMTLQKIVRPKPNRQWTVRSNFNPIWLKPTLDSRRVTRACGGGFMTGPKSVWQWRGKRWTRRSGLNPICPKRTLRSVGITIGAIGITPGRWKRFMSPKKICQTTAKCSGVLATSGGGRADLKRLDAI